MEFSDHINILTGENGSGKTNLIEAIYILSMARSFRTNSDVEMIGFDADHFRVKGLFERGKYDLSVEIRMARAGKEKRIIVDGIQQRKNADLLDFVYTVIFTPDDLRIISDEPDKRRKFMDRELFQIKPLYYLDVVRYRKALRNRNLLLKAERQDENLISVYDGYLAESGARIMLERAGFAQKLADISTGIFHTITDGKENLEVSYEPSVELSSSASASAPGAGAGAAEAQRELILAALAARRDKDRESGSTGVGPHKDDIKLVSDGTDIRKYGSRGQQRTAALALKLAELSIIYEETGEHAILLLDDVLSELDEGRQKHLTDSFEGHQIFITSAELPGSILKKYPDSEVFVVEEGNVSARESI
jgi:DNA replication and repair protein RecF